MSFDWLVSWKEWLRYEKTPAKEYWIFPIRFFIERSHASGEWQREFEAWGGERGYRQFQSGEFGNHPFVSAILVERVIT